MGTKSNPGPFDCHANAAPDEPMFVLLARDKHAPTLVWLWAAMRELEGEDKAKVDEARQCVTDMILWATAHERKAVGLAQATLTGMMDLVRVANMRSDGVEPGNVSSEDLLRALLCRFRPAVEGGEDPQGL